MPAPAEAQKTTDPRLFVEACLGLVELLLECGSRLGQVAVAAVQLLHLPLQFIVLLRQASLPVVEVLVLASQLVVLCLQTTHGVLQTFELRLRVRLSTQRTRYLIVLTTAFPRDTLCLRNYACVSLTRGAVLNALQHYSTAQLYSAISDL